MLDSDNRLFVLARQGRRQPSALLAIAVTFVTLVVMIIGGQITGRFALRLLFPNAGATDSPLTDGARQLLEFTTGFLPIFLCLWAWLALWSRRPFATLGFENDRPVARFLGGGLVGAGMMSAAAITLAAFPDSLVAAGQMRTVGVVALGGALLALVGTIIQSSAEEVLFRGWLLPAIGARQRPWIAVVVSSLLFGLAHALNPNATLLGLMNLSLFGTFLALYALAEGGLWGACAWHALWNWTDNTLFGLPDSGGPIRPALLISITPRGPSMLTGGAFGPDGGLIETAILLIGIGALLLISRRRETAGR